MFHTVFEDSFVSHLHETKIVFGLEIFLHELKDLEIQYRQERDAAKNQEEEQRRQQQEYKKEYEQRTVFEDSFVSHLHETKIVFGLEIFLPSVPDEK